MSEPTTVEGAASPAAPRPRRRMWRRVLLAVVPLAVAVGAGLVYLQGGRWVSTDNAYVKADRIAVSTDVSGLVAQVLVAENAEVAAGALLFRLDPSPLRIAVERAQARLAQVRTDLSALQAAYRAQQAEIALARTRLAFALKEQERQADLVARQFVSAARFDDARLAAEIAARQIAAREAELARIGAELAGGPGAPIERHPSHQAAVADLRRAELDLARAEVRAPVAGVVGRLPKPGQYVAAGSSALALVSAGELWVEANFTETELTHVRVGQAARIRVDTFRDRELQGTVESVSPASGSEFSILPAQNATGNWVKIAQRVPVRIRFAPGSDLALLRSGLSAEVRVDTGHRRSLFGPGP
jgi:membrane fusion protein (multidrug efflux system)